MLKDPVLNKALKLIRRGKYAPAIKMLEFEAVRYQESFLYYYILGLACLYARDFGGAFTYFNRARNINDRETGPLLGLALFFLKRGDTEKAVNLYLDVQDIDERNRIAKRALALIRKSESEELSLRIESGKARNLYPPIPGGRRRWKRAVIPALLVLCAALAAAGAFRFIKNIPHSQRPGLEAIALTAEEAAALAPEESADYNAARAAFTGYHDEKAKYYINRLLRSNASRAVKDKALIMKNFTVEPDFASIRDRFTYKDVNREPDLYQDCFVVWRGYVSKLDGDEAGTSFFFQLGPKAPDVLEGSVTLVFNGSPPVQAGERIEVLGKIVMNENLVMDETQNRFTLEAKNINKVPAD